MRPKSALPLVVLAILALGLPAALAASELWVVERGSGTIAVIDTATDIVVGSIPAGDPDGDGTADPPEGIAFSTMAGQAGRYAFVTQRHFVSVIDVLSRQPARPAWNLSTFPGLANVILRGVAAARPRLVRDASGGMRLVSHLHVAGTLPGGKPVFIVLDQQRLLLTFGSPLIATGSLAAVTDATALDVTTLETPAGERTLRAWYTIARTGGGGSSIEAIAVGAPARDGASWAAAAAKSFPLPPLARAPRRVGLGAPRSGEAPVLPTGATGSLENLDTGGRCQLGGEIVAASVTGFGLGSYTVFALDAASESLRAIDPHDCAEPHGPFAVGAGPVAMTTLAELRWTAAFVANHDDDTITRLDADGTLTTIDLGGSGGGACSRCPIALGVVPSYACVTDGLLVSREDGDSDGSDDDARIDFSGVGCSEDPEPDTEYIVACRCLDDPDCACRCDCDADPDPDCFCPGMSLSGAAAPRATGGVGGDTPTGLIGTLDPPTGPYPWKELGKTLDTLYLHLDGALADGSWAYKAEVETAAP